MTGKSKVALLAGELGVVVVAGTNVEVVGVGALDDGEDVVGAEGGDPNLGETRTAEWGVGGGPLPRVGDQLVRIVDNDGAGGAGLSTGPDLVDGGGGRGLLLLAEQVGDVDLVDDEEQHDDPKGDQRLADPPQHRARHVTAGPLPWRRLSRRAAHGPS